MERNEEPLKSAEPQYREEDIHYQYQEYQEETENSFPNPEKYQEFPTFESFKIK